MCGGTPLRPLFTIPTVGLPPRVRECRKGNNLSQLVLAGGGNKAQHGADALLGFVAPAAGLAGPGRLGARRSPPAPRGCPRPRQSAPAGLRSRRQTPRATAPATRCGKTVDDRPHAGATHVGQLLACKVHALHQRAAVDPLQALVPSLYRGRLKEALPHVQHIVGYTLDSQLRSLVAARHADGAPPPFPPAL